MLACGGGMTGFLNYLAAWRELDLPMDVTVYTSRPDVVEAVRSAEPELDLIPYASGKRSTQVFLLRQTQLGKLIEKNGADVILSTNSTVGRTKLPQIIHHRNLLWFDSKGTWEALRSEGAIWALRYFLWGKAGKKALRTAAANIFISDYMRSIAESVVPERDGRNHTIHNGLAAEVIEDSNHINQWTAQPSIAAVTSDCPHKCNPTLIRMLAYLVETRPEVPWKLEIAGGGEYGAEKALADQLGLNKNIYWLGFLNRSELETLYRRSVCLAFVSSVEAFGNPPLEAMARSCPVVASDCTAMPEVCGDAAQLVPVRDHEAFGKSVIRYWDAPDFRNEKIELGRARVKQFQWKKSARKMFEIFQAVHRKNQNVK
jgi:glycosyltransferase involved in cell wall biosynthesis